jgi:hypothetical protein
VRKEQSVVALTNAVKSLHFPPTEWHSHTSPLKSYVSSISARTPFCRTLQLRWEIMCIRYEMWSNRRIYQVTQKLHLTDQWLYPPGCRRWHVEFRCAMVPRGWRMSCASWDRRTCWTATSYSEEDQTKTNGGRNIRGMKRSCFHHDFLDYLVQTESYILPMGYFEKHQTYQICGEN